MKRILILFFFLFVTVCSDITAQDKPTTVSLSMDLYEKAKTFKVADLDKDTYVKFENTYVLDRYEGRKPYFITGDDGKKKRIDLYKLLLKEGMKELGTVIYYTTETGKLYEACLPGFTSDAKVWEKYFEDIHAIDKTEPNFVLKLSYILSKELGFQLYKSANAGKDISKEAGTYGSDICFPGDVEVAMWDGTKKVLSEIKEGDKIVTVDPQTKLGTTTVVQKLISHEEKNYAITRLKLLTAGNIETDAGTEIDLATKEITATPNHPVLTTNGEISMGKVKEGDEILCFDETKGKFQKFLVWSREENAGGFQKVYNIETAAGDTFIVNDVMVLKKHLDK